MHRKEIFEVMNPEDFQYDADDKYNQKYGLTYILSFETSQLMRLFGKVSRGGEKFFADKRVIAGGDKEGYLAGHGCAGSLDGTATEAGFCQYQRFGIKCTEIEIGGWLFPHNYSIYTGYIAKLVVGKIKTQSGS